MDNAKILETIAALKDQIGQLEMAVGGGSDMEGAEMPAMQAEEAAAGAEGGATQGAEDVVMAPDAEDPQDEVSNYFGRGMKKKPGMMPKL